MNNTEDNMSCEHYVYNISKLLALYPPKNQTREEITYSTINNILVHFCIPVICVFGILGNMLSLLILTRKQLQTTMNCMEKSAHLGLVSLAVSDMMFCIAALPIAFIPDKSIWRPSESKFMLYYSAYYEPLLNTFMLSSTWLTVVMAMGRYLAICHPLHARGFVDLPATRVAISTIFILSPLFNLPCFWRYRVIKNESNCYQQVLASLYLNKTFRYAYYVAWAVIGVFIPLIILTFCNICLIKALRKSNQMRRLYRAGQTPDDSGHRLTPTLISIIVLLMVLVCPSEILKFSYLINTDLKPQLGNHHYFRYQTATAFMNFFQVINFAVNFILYCAINVHFRKTMKSLLCCKKEQKRDVLKTNHLTVSFNMSDVETEN